MGPRTQGQLPGRRILLEHPVDPDLPRVAGGDDGEHGGGCLKGLLLAEQVELLRLRGIRRVPGHVGLDRGGHRERFDALLLLAEVRGHQAGEEEHVVEATRRHWEGRAGQVGPQGFGGGGGAFEVELVDVLHDPRQPRFEGPLIHRRPAASEELDGPEGDRLVPRDRGEIVGAIGAVCRNGAAGQHLQTIAGLLAGFALRGRTDHQGGRTGQRRGHRKEQGDEPRGADYRGAPMRARHVRSAFGIVVTSTTLSLLLAQDAQALDGGQRPLSAAPCVLVGVDVGEEIGASVALPGDLDGDGRGELAVGAPGADDGRGRLYLFQGAAVAEACPAGRGGHLSSNAAWVTFEGDSPGGRLGERVLAAGDWDGDGWPDLVIGAPSHPNADAPPGRVALIRGGPDRLTADTTLAEAAFVIDGPGIDARLGDVMDGGRDLDGDGRSDLVFLTQDDNSNSTTGTVWVVPGRALGDVPTAPTLERLSAGSFSGEGFTVPGQQLRHSIAIVDDLDGDLRPDLALGRPASDGAAQRVGRVTIVSGIGHGGDLEVGVDDVAIGERAGTAFDERFGMPLSFVGTGASARLWIGAAGSSGSLTTRHAFDGATPLSDDGEIRATGARREGLRVIDGALFGDGVRGIVSLLPAEGSLDSVLSVFPLPPDGPVDIEGAFAVLRASAEDGLVDGFSVGDVDGDSYDDLFVGAPLAHQTGVVWIYLGAGSSDGDTYSAPLDCDDSRLWVGPDQPERGACADALDDDCDGLIDGEDPDCAVVGSGLVFACDHGGTASTVAWVPLAAILLALRRRRRLLPLVLALGCANGSEGLPPASLTVLHPVEDGRSFGRVLPVEVEVAGRRLAPESDGLRAGPDEVLWKLWLDGIEIGVSGGRVQIVDRLDAGNHRLVAELVDPEQHEPLNPPISQEVDFQFIGGTPSITVLSPSPNAVVPPSGFDVAYDVDSFYLDAASIGGAPSDGAGHVLVFLDGVPVSEPSTNGVARVEGAAVGPHTLRVALAQNDGNPLGDPVFVEVPIEVVETRIDIDDPLDGGTVTGPGIVAGYSVQGFTLEPPGGTAQDGRGHVHVHLDGVYRGISSTGSAELPEVNGCTHTIRLELALADHTPLGVDDEITVEYRPCVAVEAPAAGSDVAGPDVAVGFLPQGFTFDPTELAGIPQGNHAHIYVDGAFVGSDVSGTGFLVEDLSAGDHEVEIRLAHAGHIVGLPETDEEAPVVSATVEFTVLP